MEVGVSRVLTSKAKQRNVVRVVRDRPAMYHTNGEWVIQRFPPPGIYTGIKGSCHSEAQGPITKVTNRGYIALASVLSDRSQAHKLDFVLDGLRPSIPSMSIRRLQSLGRSHKGA